MLGKIKKIWTDLSENILNSDYFIRILQKKTWPTFNCPNPAKHLAGMPMDGVIGLFFNQQA